MHINTASPAFFAQPYKTSTLPFQTSSLTFSILSPLKHDSVHFGATAAIEKTGFTRDNPLQATVVENTRLTEDDQVHRVVLDVGRDYQWEPGQVTTVFTDHPSDAALRNEPGKGSEKHSAEYSIASAYDPKNPRLAIIVKRADKWEDGEITYKARASNDLCDAELGKQIKLLDPISKNLVLPNQGIGNNIVFIGGGTGIAPLCSYLPSRRNTDDSTVILYGVSNHDGFLERERIENFIKETPGAKAVVAYSGEPKSDVSSDTYLSLRRSPKLMRSMPDMTEQSGVRLDKLLLDKKVSAQVWKLLKDENTIFLFCGSQGMLKSLDVSMETICQQYDQSWQIMKGIMKREGRWREEAA